MNKESKNIFEMTNEEASIIIGNIPVYPTYPGDDYSIAEYQWAKSMAIQALEQQPFINKPCISEGVCREDKIQVLDKIRTEVEQRKKNSGGDPSRDLAFNVCLQIIDKYKAESEDKE